MNLQCTVRCFQEWLPKKVVSKLTLFIICVDFHIRYIPSLELDGPKSPTLICATLLQRAFSLHLNQKVRNVTSDTMEEQDADAAMREMMGFGSFGSNKRQKLNTGSTSRPPSEYLPNLQGPNLRVVASRSTPRPTAVYAMRIQLIKTTENPPRYVGVRWLCMDLHCQEPILTTS